MQQVVTHRLSKVFIGAVLLMMCLGPSLLQAQAAPESLPDSGDRFYVQMQKEEFLLNLLPKEKFLLHLVQNVTAEIERRQREGIDTNELGVRELTTPEERKVDTYRSEMKQTVNLMDEIAELERLAKQKVDFTVLEALAKLKEQVREIIDESGQNLAVAAADSSLVEAPEPEETVPEPEPEIEESTTSTDENLIYDIYEQWRYNRILQYKVKHTQYEFLRLRLLRSATPKQEERMFRRALKAALETYAQADLETSRLLLNDLITTYNDGRVLDDVKYYAAESAFGLNRLDEALAGYERLEADHPLSEYAAKGLVKRIYIKYIYTQFADAADLYSRLQLKMDRLTEEEFGTVSYLIGFAHFRTGQYNKALTALANVTMACRYFYPSIYLSAACYTNMGMDDLAVPIYERLANENPTGVDAPILAQIQNNALLKLGLIYYERGQNETAIAYFDRVSATAEAYDLSLMGKAWSAYRSGRPGEALKNVEGVLESSMLSSYVYEARVLAASSKDLMGQSDSAIEDLKKVVEATRSSDDASADEEARAKSGVESFEQVQQTLLMQRNRDIFDEIERIRKFFQTAPGRRSMAGAERQFDSERTSLENQVAGLDQLEAQARQRGNLEALNRIRRLRSQVIETLDDHAGEFAFDPDDPLQDPLIQRLGLAEYFKYMFRSLLMETLKEKESTRDHMVTVETQLAMAKSTENFDATLDAELRKEELNDYYARLNQYEVWLRENTPKEVRIELDRWAAFSGYGISAINFNRIRDIEKRMVHVSNIIQTMDEVFQDKRKMLDARIKNLLNDVSAIEKEMEREADEKTRRRQEQFFKTQYFDERTKESAVGNIKPVKQQEKGGRK